MALKKKSKSSSILDKAHPVSELNLILTALFYGRSGTGKTTLSGSFPKPLLLVDIREKGTDSLLDEKGVNSIRIDDWSDIEELYWELKESDHNYKTVVIDALHSAQSLAIAEAKARANKKEDEQTSQRDFGQAGTLLVEWMLNFRDLQEDGINVVFLSHDRTTSVDTEDDADVIIPEVGPRLMPSVASAIVGSVNVVGNTYIRETITKPKKVGNKTIRKTEYCLRIGPHGYYTTKIRKPKKFDLPEFIVDPSYDKLISIIRGESSGAVTKRKLKRRK